MTPLNSVIYLEVTYIETEWLQACPIESDKKRKTKVFDLHRDGKIPVFLLGDLRILN